MVEWNGIFRLFRFFGILGQPREVLPKFRNEILENVCSIRSPTRDFRNFWSNGKRPWTNYCWDYYRSANRAKHPNFERKKQLTKDSTNYRMLKNEVMQRYVQSTCSVPNIFFFLQNRQLCKEYKSLKQAWQIKMERHENNPRRK